MSGKKIVPPPNAVVFDSEVLKADFTVRTALAVDGVLRVFLVDRAKQMPEDTIEQKALKTLAGYAYPKLISCVDKGTIEVAGKVYEARNLPFEIFAILPESFIFGDWYEITDRLNPDLAILQAQPDPKKN